MINIGDSFKIEEGKGVITVTDFCGDNKSVKVTCSFCNGRYPEFYPDNFEYHISAFKKKVYPCGCRKGRRLPYELKIQIAEDYCNDNGYGLISYDGKGKLKIFNPFSGNEWEVRFSDIKRGQKDPSLKYDVHKKDDEYFVDAFYNTGCFEDGTIFCRSDKKTTQGSKNYWKVRCPVCYPKTKKIYEGLSVTLMKGNRPCECPKSCGFYGLYEGMYNKKDALYFIDIPYKGYFKVGRTFNMERRLKENKKRIDNYYEEDISVRVSEQFQADHITIFTLEQLIVGRHQNPIFNNSYPENGYGSSELLKNGYYKQAVTFAKEYIEEWWK